MRRLAVGRGSHASTSTTLDSHTCTDPHTDVGTKLPRHMSEREVYRASRMLTTSLSLVNWSSKALFFLPMFGIIQFAFSNASLTYACVTVVVPLSSCGFLYFGSESLCRLIRRNPVLFGSIFQLSFFSCLLFVAVCAAPIMPTPLMQHRIYLTSVLPTLTIAPTVGSVPRETWALMLAIYYCAWVTFHYIVNFLQPGVLIFGILHCLLSDYIFCKADEQHWDNFKLTKALQHETHMLDVQKRTQDGMLASLFDASCVCDRNGKLLQCTLQLQQLLAGGRHVLGESIWAFATFPAEKDRLQKFFKDSARNAVNQAATIQATFNRVLPTIAGSASLCLEGSVEPFEVVLYAIRRAAHDFNKDDKADSEEACEELFVGFQARAFLPGVACELEKTGICESSQSGQDELRSVGFGVPDDGLQRMSELSPPTISRSHEIPFDGNETMPEPVSAGLLWLAINPLGAGLEIVSTSDAFQRKCGHLASGTQLLQWVQNANDFYTCLTERTNLYFNDDEITDTGNALLVFRTPSSFSQGVEYYATYSISFDGLPGEERSVATDENDAVDTVGDEGTVTSQSDRIDAVILLRRIQSYAVKSSVNKF